MAIVKWQGQLPQGYFRVVDAGVGAAPRVLVEVRQGADAMGAQGWGRFDPIPRDVLEALLIASGVIT